MKKDPANENIAQDKLARMDCSQFMEALYELDRPGTPGASVREGALAHAEMCSSCGALVTEAESLDFALGQISQQVTELQAPPRIEAALLREFRREKSQAASRRLRFQLAVVGIAAVILLALGLTLRRPQTVVPGSKTASVTASTVAPASSRLDSREPSASTVPAMNASVGPRPTHLRATAEKTAASDSGAAEYATAYVPLPYAYDPSDLEGGAVVRVVLPRAALISYGLPVEAMGVSDQVTADMVVSEDGTPQAIRLVAQGNAATDD